MENERVLIFDAGSLDKSEVKAAFGRYGIDAVLVPQTAVKNAKYLQNALCRYDQKIVVSNEIAFAKKLAAKVGQGEEFWLVLTDGKNFTYEEIPSQVTKIVTTFQTEENEKTVSVSPDENPIEITAKFAAEKLGVQKGVENDKSNDQPSGRKTHKLGIISGIRKKHRK